MSDSKRLINNTKVFAIGNIVAKACQYLLITLCTYKLTTAEYGIADTIIQIAALFVPIFTFDIAGAVFRFSMDPEIQKEKVYTNALFIGALGFIISVILFPVFNLVPFFQERIRYVYLLTAFEILQLSTKEYIRGTGKTFVYMIGGILNAVFQIIGCLIFVYLFDLNLFGYILALTAAYAFECCFYFFKIDILKQISFNQISADIYRKLLSFSIPLAPNTIMWWLIGASDRYFVLWIISESATGLYAVAAKFPALITIVTSIFFKAWEISAVENKQAEQRELFYNKIFNLLLGTMTVLLGFAVVAIKPIIMLFVAPEFRQGWIFAPFLLLAATFSSFQTFLGVNYTVEKDSLGTLKSTTFAAIMNLILNYFLIKSIGIQGATISTAVSYFAVAFYRFFDTRKYIHTEIKNFHIIAISYILILIEITIISFIPDLYLVSIPASIVIVILNKNCVTFILSIIKKLIKNLFN